MSSYQMRRRHGQLLALPNRYGRQYHTAESIHWPHHKWQLQQPLPWHDPLNQQVLAQILARYADYQALRKHQDPCAEDGCQHHGEQGPYVWQTLPDRASMFSQPEYNTTLLAKTSMMAMPMWELYDVAHIPSFTLSPCRPLLWKPSTRMDATYFRLPMALAAFSSSPPPCRDGHRMATGKIRTNGHATALSNTQRQTAASDLYAHGWSNHANGQLSPYSHANVGELAVLAQRTANMTPTAWQNQTLAHSNAILHQALTEAQQQLQQLAHYVQFLEHETGYDTLTNTPNRCLFNDRLTQTLQHAERYHRVFAILFIDLDRFKQINDLQGHSAGDLVLKTIAQRLRRCLRHSDTVCRYGGDEFIVLLSGITASADAAQVAQSIINSVAQPITYAASSLQVGASIGISLYPQDGQTASSLIHAADIAMYDAKRLGGQTFQWASPPRLPIAPIAQGLSQLKPSTLAK